MSFTTAAQAPSTSVLMGGRAAQESVFQESQKRPLNTAAPSIQLSSLSKGVLWMCLDAEEKWGIWYTNHRAVRRRGAEPSSCCGAWRCYLKTPPGAAKFQLNGGCFSAFSTTLSRLSHKRSTSRRSTGKSRQRDEGWITSIWASAQKLDNEDVGFPEHVIVASVLSRKHKW